MVNMIQLKFINYTIKINIIMGNELIVLLSVIIGMFLLFFIVFGIINLLIKGHFQKKPQKPYSNYDKRK